ncbi:putative AAA-ATPase [Balamuthia mandrillaris]
MPREKKDQKTTLDNDCARTRTYTLKKNMFTKLRSLRCSSLPFFSVSFSTKTTPTTYKQIPAKNKKTKRVATSLPTILPSSSSFAELREPNTVYVDKTCFLPLLLQPHAQHFLSRPRKFGKSLLHSTIQEVFGRNGDRKKQLFQGLWVEKNAPHLLNAHLPVLSLDFSRLPTDGGPAFRQGLLQSLHLRAEENGFSLSKEASLETTMEQLVLGLVSKSQAEAEGEEAKKGKIVVLIDEYDAPITCTLHPDPSQNGKALENREILHNFFSVLKSLSPHFEYMLVTGVSRFGCTALFSGANQLIDISFFPEYSTLLGYTWEEVKKAFARHLKVLSKEKNLSREDLRMLILEWYNGYSWRGDKRVLNPFSINMLFSRMEFKPYWATQGSPAWLLRLLTLKCLLVDIPMSLNESKPISSFEKIELESLGRSLFETESLLLQTGYLTIASESQNSSLEAMLRLRYPNKEVRASFLFDSFKHVLEVKKAVQYTQLDKLLESFNENNPEDFYARLDMFYSAVPHTIYKKNSKELSSAEALYSAMLCFLMQALPSQYTFQFKSSTSDGVMDYFLESSNQRWIVEHKILKEKEEQSGLSQDRHVVGKDHKAQLLQCAEKALLQIEKKSYAAKFSQGDLSKPTTLVGVCFDAQTRWVGALKTRHFAKGELEAWLMKQKPSVQ